MTRAFALLTAAALLLSGCSPTMTEETEPLGRLRLDPAGSMEGPAPVGRFYVAAGPQSLKSDLWTISLDPMPEAERLTRHGRVTTLDGCPESVVVAAAQEEVGWVDTLQRIEGGRLVRINGLGDDTASSPDVADDCTILYSSPAGRTEKEILRFDPATGLTTSVVKGPHVAGAKWGPEGEVLVLERRPAPVLVILRPDGTSTEIEAGVPDLGNTPWGKGGWIAGDVFSGADPSIGTLFINPTTGGRSILEGWRPLAWSPAGDQLLVAESTDGSHLGVVDLADLTKVRRAGISKAGPVWDAVWLPT